MKDLNVRTQFVALRAKGKSLTTCAKELGVSRQTLANWEHQYDEEIQHLKAVELDALAEEYWMRAQGRIELKGELLRRVKEELERRDLSKVSTAKLFELELKLVAELKKEPSAISVMSTEQIEQAVLHRDMLDSPLSVYTPAPERRTPLFALEKLDNDEKVVDNADSN